MVAGEVQQVGGRVGRGDLQAAAVDPGGVAARATADVEDAAGGGEVRVQQPCGELELQAALGGLEPVQLTPVERAVVVADGLCHDIDVRASFT
ncbi:hypothetical protein GCM10010435_22340 [Winogradskya consettensis]|uniref:Uncharacterized protein n=1 Tax=Winogradskya consettensis TaxID=113560 RepID=A0A919T3J4_9ACTN|nr:hypothetical protein Aco04nite_95050 [Actinoplanes consettensis]